MDNNINILDKKFNHKHWFKGSNMTVKEFLDYVLLHSGDFYIKIKYSNKSDYLLDIQESNYYLTDMRYSYKLNSEECKYLAEHNNYFKSKICV